MSRSLVEVCGNFGCVTGVVVFHPRYVAVVDAVARLGRGIEVTDLEGNVIDATLYGVDEQESIALLRLDKNASGAVALQPSTAAVVPGDSLDAWSIEDRRSGDPIGSTSRSTLVVTSASDYQIETAASSVEAGVPLVDCDGRLVGIRNFAGWGFTRAAAVKRLWDELPSSDPIDGQRHFTGGYGIANQMQSDRFWVGVEGGFALSLQDRWELPVHFGVKLNLLESSLIPGLRRGRAQISHELGIGYRALLAGGALPIYIVPSVGLGTTCELEWVQLGGESELTDARLLAQPVFRINLRLSGADIGYSFRTGVDSKDDAHQVTFGFWF